MTRGTMTLTNSLHYIKSGLTHDLVKDTKYWILLEPQNFLMLSMTGILSTQAHQATMMRMNMDLPVGTSSDHPLLRVRSTTICPTSHYWI